MTDFNTLMLRQTELMGQVSLTVRDVEVARKMQEAQGAVIYAAQLTRDVWAHNERLAHEKVKSLDMQLMTIREQLATMGKPDV